MNIFEGWNMINIYFYLDLLFGSLSLSLFIEKNGIEIIKVIFQEIIKKLGDDKK